jgi:uncharacterized protein YegL
MTFQDAAKRKEDLIKAARERSAKTDALVKPKEYIKPEQATSRLRIIFDNSGSMMGSKIHNAKLGTVEFLKNCTLNKDAVAVHLLENPYGISQVSSNIINSILMTDLAQLASDIDTDAITAWAGTPLFECILRALKATPQATRLIVFSDGEPNNRTDEKECITVAKEQKSPIDCVFIGNSREEGAKLLKNLAEATGGIFLVFDPAKGVNFADALKYLTPTKRLMLMDSSFKAKLERGEVK